MGNKIRSLISSMLPPTAAQRQSTLDGNDLKTSCDIITALSELQSSIHEEGCDEQDTNRRWAWETTEVRNSIRSMLPPIKAQRQSTLDPNDSKPCCDIITALSELQFSIHEVGCNEQGRNQRSVWKTTEVRNSI